MTIDIWSILLEKQLNFCFSVSHTGLEPFSPITSIFPTVSFAG